MIFVKYNCELQELMMTKKLKIWIATIGEPVPSDGKDVRLLRSGQFAFWLGEREHIVRFITNSVDHYARKQRFHKTTEVAYSKNINLTFLWARTYKKSLSLARYFSHYDAQKSFEIWIEQSQNKPDIIIASYPTYQLSNALAKYAIKNRVPILIDCRDAWPDIFYESTPRAIKPFLSLYIFFYTRRVQKLFMKSTGILAHCSEFLDWALKKASRNQKHTDKVFHFTYPTSIKPSSNFKKNNDNEIRVIYAGTLTKRNDLQQFISAFKKTEDAERNLKLIIAGTGDDYGRLNSISNMKNLNIEFMGWLSLEELVSEFANSDFALLPYLRSDFKMSLPNKFVEYLANSLPVICVGNSAFASLVTTNKCGIVLDSNIGDLNHSLEAALSKVEKSQIRTFSKNAKALYDEKFNQNVVFKDMEAHLMQIVDER